MEMNTSHFILATTQDVIKVFSTETEGDDQIFEVDMLEYFSVDNQQFYIFFVNQVDNHIFSVDKQVFLSWPQGSIMKTTKRQAMCINNPHFPKNEPDDVVVFFVVFCGGCDGWSFLKPLKKVHEM